MARKGTASVDRLDLSTALPSLQSSTTLPNRLYKQLEAAIISGALQPGQRLHSDDLAAHFGVSRIPIREALSSLDQAGWVEITPRHGVHVRERDATELQELFEFRAHVEGLVARWAAERRTNNDLTAMQYAVNNSRPATAPTTDELLMNTSSTFRDALREAAHNSVLAATSAALEKRARFYFSTVVHQLGDEWMHVHQELLTLVRTQNADDAAALSSRHIITTGEAVHDLLFTGS